MTTILISKYIKNTVVGTFPLLFAPPPPHSPWILDQPQNTAVQMNWRCCQDFDATDKNRQLSKNMVISWTRNTHYGKNMRPKDFMGRNSFSRLQCCVVIKIGRDKFRDHRQSVETVDGTKESSKLLTQVGIWWSTNTPFSQIADCPVWGVSKTVYKVNQVEFEFQSVDQ